MTGWGEAGGFTTPKEWTHNTEGKGLQTGSSVPTKGMSRHTNIGKHTRRRKWCACTRQTGWIHPEAKFTHSDGSRAEKIGTLAGNSNT